MTPAQLRDAQANGHAMVDALAKADPDALLVVNFVAGRMLAGLEKYGRLDLASDRRDFRRELGEELGDLLTYAAMAELRRILSHGGR